MAIRTGGNKIPSRPGRGGDFSPIKPYNPPPAGAAAQDLGLNNDTIQRTQAELDLMQKRKKILGQSAAPVGSAAVAALTGTGY